MPISSESIGCPFHNVVVPYRFDVRFIGSAWGLVSRRRLARRNLAGLDGANRLGVSSAQMSEADALPEPWFTGHRSWGEAQTSAIYL